MNPVAQIAHRLHEDEIKLLDQLRHMRRAKTQRKAQESTFGDRVADWVAGRHGLSVEALTSGRTAPETAANLLLSDRLERTWRDDGLAAWLGVAS